MSGALATLCAMPTQWESRFTNHALWTVVDQLREAVEPIKLDGDADLDDALRRLHWMLEQLQAHREASEVRGYTPTMLDNVQRQVGNVQASVNQYVADPGAYGAHLTQAASQADTVFDAMAGWPTLPPGTAAIAAGRTYSRLAEAEQSALEDLSSKVDELSAHVDGIRETGNAESAKLETLRAEFDAGAEEAIQEKLEEVAQRYLGEVEDSINEIDRRVASTKDREAEINELASQSRHIVEAVSRRVVADDYQKNARNKSFGGWVWDIMGIVVGGAPLVLLLIHFFQVDPDDQTGISLTLTRIGVSGAALGLAFLCFRRGTAYHSEARRAKHADLRMRTVHGFIANQDPVVKTAILEGMADRIYLQGLMESDTSEYQEGLIEKYIDRVRERMESDDEDQETPA
jgi:hypothetical protein